MTAESSFPLVAVEIGNSRIKVGLFDRSPSGDSLPQPVRTLVLDADQWEPLEIALWLAPQIPASVNWVLSSVRRDAAERLQEWLSGEEGRHVLLSHRDLDLEIKLANPERAGIDRLVGGVAANKLRPADRPAIVVDLGSAITVDVVSADGTFCGGAILPGISMSARALATFTDQLPELKDVPLDTPPPPLGTSTDEAITSGLFWGAVGAIRALIDQLHTQMTSDPLIILTGGGARGVAEALGSDVRYEPDLLLAGIALTIADESQT